MSTNQHTRLPLAIRLCIVIGLGAAIQQTRAEDPLLGEYSALLSERDHVSATGDRHTTIADVLIQDRINYHERNLADSLDEGDELFGSEANRILIAQLLRNRPVDDETADVIVDEPGAIIWVSIYRASDGTEYFRIIVI